MKRGWLAPAIVAALTFLTFLPVLWNGFVEIDDDRDLLDNLNWRGLGWTQLKWMFTPHKDYYRPLAWVTHGLDYSIWGLDPFGHHLTSLLVHVANAVFFYFLCRRLIALAVPISHDDKSWRLALSAGFAALLFAIHPLRAESVAWVAERKDVLAGLFFLSSVYCYLRAHSNSRQRWIIAAVVTYLLSLISKPTGTMLPVALVILDIYVLKRLPPDPRQWFTERRVLWEKIPFILIGAACTLISLAGETQTLPWRHPLAVRLLNGLYGPSRYLWQTLVPVNLSPFYAIPPDSNQDPVIILGGIATLALTFLFFVLKNRWAWACWLWMMVILVPALGVVQFGGSTFLLIGDRFTYLSCLGWTTLAGGVLFGFLKVSTQTRREKRRGEVKRPFALRAITAAVIILGVLAPLAWRHAKVWRTTETMYRQVLRYDENSHVAHNNLASFLQRQGNHAEAIVHYEQALKVRPHGTNTHFSMALLQGIQGHWGLAYSLAAIGKMEEAEKHYQQSLQLYRAAKADNPGGLQNQLPNNYYQYLLAHIEKSKAEKALKLNPDNAAYHAGLAKILAQQGQTEKAEAHFRRAIELGARFVFSILACEPFTSPTEYPRPPRPIVVFLTANDGSSGNRLVELFDTSE